ncbi:MAG: hypothetical protein ACM3TU_00560 [Bacillota bacterium]
MRFSEERLKALCDSLVAKYPNEDCDFYKMALSVEVLRELVDNEWTNQAIFPNQHPVSSKSIQEAITFLRTNENGFQFQERVSKLAIRLLNMQDIKGLQKVIQEIQSGDIHGGYAELEAGDFLSRRNVPFEFVIPSGEKRKDFDIRITTEPHINCEVKHKVESTIISKETLESVLSSANKQVPVDEPALFFIKIPEEWASSSDFNNVIERVSGTFLPRNTNVVGFILHWEERVRGSQGCFFWKYHFKENKDLVLDAGDMLRQLRVAVDPLDTFIRVMQRNIEKCRNYPFVH